jgi:hypothetical protein
MPALIQAIRGAIEQVAGMVPIEERF